MFKKIKGKTKWDGFKNINETVVSMPESTQDLIPIASIAENGTFEIEKDNDNMHLFDRVYQFTDINFTTKDPGKSESIMLQYAIILNGLNVNFKIITANFIRDKKSIESAYLSKENQTKIESEIAESINSLIDERMNNSACSIDQNKYLVLTVKKKTYEDADMFFDQTENQLAVEFASLGSRLVRINGVDRLGLLYRAYRCDPSVRFCNKWDDLMAGEFKDNIAPTNITPIDGGLRQYLKIDDKYVCTLVIRKNGYPSQLSTKFIRQLTSLSMPSLVTLDVTPIPPDVLQETLQSKLDNVESKISKQQEVRNKNEQYSSDITRNVQKEKANIESYLDEATENDQKMFFSQLLITIFADSEVELNSRIDNVQQIGRSVMVDLAPYCMQQVEAFSTALPAGGRYVNIMLRSLFTNALICFIPFNVQELYHFKGRFYGINELSKKLVVGDRRKLLNGNGWIFGIPGTGKSFFAKLEVAQILAGSSDDIIIIDPQNEYREIINKFNGQYINLSASSNNYVNPLKIDVIAAEKNMNEFITSKAEFTLDILAQVKGEALDMQERSTADKATRNMYFEILSLPKTEWIEPTFYNLRASLEELDTPTSKDLAAGLYPFTEGSLSLFAHKSNVKIHNRLIAYGTKDLGKELTKMSMLIMLESIRSRINLNQSIGKSTWVFVDEAHELTEEEYTSKSLARSWKEVRKQGGFMTGITQNVSDALKNKTTQTMVANSEFLMILGQADVDIDILLNVIDMSKNELNFIRTEEPGFGLLRFGKTVIPVNNQIPKDSLLYGLFNTNIHEKKEQGDFADIGGN